MRNKSAKLRKLEGERYSILTGDLEHCYLCGKSPVDIHEIYGGCNRIASIKNGFCVPLCRTHHRQITDGEFIDGYDFNNELKQNCQIEFERTHTREEWFKIIGRNYL